MGDVEDFQDRFHSIESERDLERKLDQVELCVVDGREISIPIFKGSGFCSIDCRKEAGADVSSVGTVMFVTTDERHKIMKAREKKAHPKRELPDIVEPAIGTVGRRLGHPGGR